MAVRGPARRPHVHLHVAGHAAAVGAGADSKHGVDEVGAGLKVPAAAGLHHHALAGVGDDLRPQPVGIPDALEVALGAAALRLQVVGVNPRRHLLAGGQRPVVRNFGVVRSVVAGEVH